MKHNVVFEIKADVPEDNEALVHDAIVAARPHVDGLVEALKTIGLLNVQQKPRVGRVMGPRAKASAPVEPSAEAAE